MVVLKDHSSRRQTGHARAGALFYTLSALVVHWWWVREAVCT